MSTFSERRGVACNARRNLRSETRQSFDLLHRHESLGGFRYEENRGLSALTSP